MRGSLKAVLVIGMVVGSSIVGAQVQPTSEAQLNNGFLGDQNARLSSQDTPAPDSYVARAAIEIERRDYARALAILRPHRRTHDLAYHFLAGRAHHGLGDYSSARRELTEAIRRRKTFIGAHLALGLLEAEHGDRNAAVKILDGLKARQSECAGTCREVADLAAAVDAIEAALRARQN